MSKNNKNVTIPEVVNIPENLFSDMVIQIFILKETYDKLVINRELNVFQKKILLKNKQQNLDTIKQIELLSEKL